jgi:large subunit ribosomal protein L10
MEKFGRTSKEYMVKEMAECFKNYPDFFVTSFSQVSVGDMEKLRKGLKKDSAAYVVVKNSMLKRAIKESGKDVDLKGILPFISGSCGILFSRGDSIAMSRTLVGFSKEHGNLKIQGGFMGGEEISLDTIRLLASLPTRDVLLAITANTIKAPISGFVGVLHNMLRNLVGVVEAIRKKKEE